jgi:predicted nucleotidyltransferase
VDCPFFVCFRKEEEGMIETSIVIKISELRTGDMIASSIEQTIKACAEDFGVGAVWLFGSALNDYRRAKDIDLAVEGLAPEKFFDFYSRLFFELSKPVDLVDLSQNPPIAGIIREKGVRIYERRS